MAQEIKNTFLKSKMNKDLDDRILPNGEYRDALNISVGRSENNDVGALENIIGNDLVASTNIGAGLTIIGIHKSNSTDEIFVFLTFPLLKIYVHRIYRLKNESTYIGHTD